MAKLAVVAAVFATVSVPLGAQAKQQLESEQLVPKVDERDQRIVQLKERLRVVIHQRNVRGRMILHLRRRLREREGPHGGRRSHDPPAVPSRSPSSSGGAWSSSTATWYGPGFYGHTPACPGNGVLTESSWWVATVPKDCGRRYTICDAGNGRCVHVTSQDTGAFTPGNFDLSPAVARALGGLHTHSVLSRVG
jgi:hypothetical protein